MKNSTGTLAWIVAFLMLEVALVNFVDRPVSDFVRDLDSAHPEITNIFRAYTDFAKSAWYLWPAAGGLFLCWIFLHTAKTSVTQHQNLTRTSHNLAFFFASLALSGLITDSIKPVLGRARPVEMVRDHLYGFQPFTFDAAMNSMPSGHATTAAALASALIILLPRGRFFWIFLGVILASSRIMVNAHYVSDVLAGSAVGVVTTVVLVRLRNAQGMFPQLNGIFPIDKKPPLS